MISTSIKGLALEQVSAASQAVGRSIVRPESADFYFPDETVLLSLSFTGLPVKKVRLVRSSTEPDQVLTAESNSVVYVTGGLRLIDIARIFVESDHDQAAAASATLDLAYLTRRFSSPPVAIAWPAQKGEQEILELTSDRDDRRKELIAHLNAHRVYYSNVVYRGLDAGTIVAMLGEYSWRGKPLVDQVEPQPLTIAGNYLVFRAPVDPVEPSGVVAQGKQKTWAELLEDRAIRMGKQSADERLIPLPTAGVFAEAVLGRSNSAEKLDITRFWQWNDSPIPLTPTEIAPVGTGSRATPEDLKPGQLGPPVLNIVNQPSLPAPAGLGAVLGAISTPNMFRDMSGLAGTQGLVQAGMEQTLHAATDAGQLASANMRTQAQKSVAMAQVAADIVKSVMGGSGGSSVQGISANGAAINHGKSLDARAASPNGNGASGGGPKNVGGAATPGVSGSNASVSGSNNGGGSSNEQAAFQRAVWGPLGESASDAAAAAASMPTAGGMGAQVAFSIPGAIADYFTYSKTASGRPDADAWGDAWLGFSKKNDHLSVEERQRVRTAAMAVADARGLPDLSFALFYYLSSHKLVKASDTEEEVFRKNDYYAKTEPKSDMKVVKTLLDGSTPPLLLGSLLFHELAHTDHTTNVAGLADPDEGHAYGVEYFLAERSRNSDRTQKIEKVMQKGGTAAGSLQSVARDLFKQSYFVMLGLAEYVDGVGSPRIPTSFGLDADKAHILINEWVAEFSHQSDNLKAIAKWVWENRTRFPHPI